MQRELTKATRELGDVRITVCRSTLASDRGEMDRALFLLSFRMERGVENLEPKWEQGTARVRAEGATSFHGTKANGGSVNLPSPEPI